MKIYKMSQDEVAEEIEKIKNYLYTSEGLESYEEFVDAQKMGDCQFIVADIISHFPNVVKMFGEVEIDDSYIDEDGEEQNFVTHHWVKINGLPYDFAKGTLRHHMEFDSLYDPEVSINEIHRYL